MDTGDEPDPGAALRATVDWTPLVKYPRFSSTATHRLEQRSDRQWTFVETNFHRLHKLSVALIGLPLSVFLTPVTMSKDLRDDETWVIIQFCANLVVTLGVGIAVALWMTSQPVFDRERNAYFRYRARKRVDDATPLTEIRALQLLGTDLDGQLELNLVLRDRSRVHVVRHGDHERLFEEANRLGEWLGVPVLKEASSPGD